jgi:multisubunit Na+/H+ antiporter MnhE subunit
MDVNAHGLYFAVSKPPLMARSLGAYAIWLLCLMGAWMLYVASTELPELVLGAASALLGTVGAAIICRHMGLPTPPRLRWILACWTLIPRLFLETAMVFGALFRQIFRRQQVTGAFRAIRYAGVYADEGTAAAADAFTITANSITPNTIVLDVDRVEGLVLVHQLVLQSQAEVEAQLIVPGP